MDVLGELPEGTKMSIFADDQLIVITGRNHEELVLKANMALDVIVGMVSKLGMSLVARKTVCCLFGAVCSETILEAVDNLRDPHTIDRLLLIEVDSRSIYFVNELMEKTGTWLTLQASFKIIPSSIGKLLEPERWNNYHDEIEELGKGILNLFGEEHWKQFRKMLSETPKNDDPWSWILPKECSLLPTALWLVKHIQAKNALDDLHGNETWFPLNIGASENLCIYEPAPSPSLAPEIQLKLGSELIIQLNALMAKGGRFSMDSWGNKKLHIPRRIGSFLGCLTLKVLHYKKISELDDSLQSELVKMAEHRNKGYISSRGQFCNDIIAHRNTLDLLISNGLYSNCQALLNNIFAALVTPAGPPELVCEICNVMKLVKTNSP
ncbi:Oidioi.mRNA.OKI2018_I69.chr1.g3516.t1.cds [Oikopleura dioica]|uniref:Oidioi.mRNA.OKI2018_I69.chr1.g3516.t1.cds n=1 Tax=Oikopleura dioica TaxID=34765 RepID=A0ABN7SYP5_OIKDI|nr:Oidioi.mRNA.OKI2018_I69.chr1.g3516.t1.cds [Oikopleura dioica]